MALQSDSEFLSKLRQYLNKEDVEKILHFASLPEQNANINRKTGRAIIGAPATKPRRILLPGSIKNYKSIILKFAKFKADSSGPELPITEEIAQMYNTKMISDDKMKYQTILTNVRVLNRYVIVPLLGMELGKPRIIDSTLMNNKPQLTHKQVINTLRYLWRKCKNKDHIYKMILIYYTGLRSMEAGDLTYRDILNAIGKDHIILRVRKGKQNCKRNVYVFKGAPSTYFRNYLLPYLETKMMLKLTNKCLEDIDDSDSEILKHLDDRIFSESSYQSAQKEFRKALRIVISDDTFNIKGAGLHSIRSDYSTRALELVYQKCKNHRVALKIVGRLLGHTKEFNIDKHYLNLGYSFFPDEDEYNDQSDDDVIDDNDDYHDEYDEDTVLQKIVKDKHTGTNENTFIDSKNIFQNIHFGSTVTETFQNNSNNVRNHANLRNVIDIQDHFYIVRSLGSDTLRTY